MIARVISLMRLQIPVLLPLIRILLKGTLLAPLVLALSACGGDDYQKEYDRDYTILGGGVDGPLTNASVAMYALLDSSGSHVVYSVAAPGTAVATGTTDQTAQIEDMLLNDGVNPPYILEFTGTASTIDLTTGEAPALNVLRTLVTQDMLDQGRPVYASPLTTIAVNIALENADDSDGVVTRDEFVSALDNAASQVKSTLGFGMDASLDIFTLPPVLDDSVDVTDSATLQQIAFYRSAIEATRVLLQQVAALVEADGDAVLVTLGQDLADDVIDGRVAGERADLFANAQAQSDALELFAQTPSELCIARDDNGGCVQTVGDISDLLVSERADIGVDTSTNVEVGAVVIEVPTLNTDRDGDGVNNDKDAFPEDADESADTDADGVGDNGDNCPALANANQADADSDGVGDACDSATNPSEDADRDGVPDRSDNCSQVANANQLNTDHDSQGNACDSDDDNDGVADTSDAFPLDADESVDTDHDGTGDNGDTNDDNDDLIDTDDNCPLVENNDQANFDEDTQGDACDTDDDNDGLSDVQEIMLGSDPNNADSDGDGHEDGGDNCPVDASDDFTDTDNDGRGDICDTDDDADGLSDVVEAELGTNPLDNDTDDDNDLDGVDNCKIDANSDQLNTDADSEGDVCDVDDDNDGRLDGEDAFPLDPDEQDDNDLDQVGNASDNCIDTANTDQSNVDHDTEGDVCDYDADNDGLGYDDEIALGTDPLDTDTDNDGDLDPQDNCPIASNANQLDTDLDGFGDACDDDDDNDGALDVDDAFPLNPNESVDTDSDAVGDGSDNCIDVPNANQLDTDVDGAGNACDDDDDNDGLSDIDEALIHSNPLLVDTDSDGDEDSNDNCILVSNASQSDTDGDGYGDACDPDG